MALRMGSARTVTLRPLPLSVRRPAVRLTIASLTGVFALLTFVVTTDCTVRGDWSAVTQAAWLRPGAELASLEYALFAVTSITFVIAGVLAYTHPPASLFCMAGGFLLALLGNLAFGMGSLGIETYLVVVLVYVAPALWFYCGGLCARRAQRF